MSEKNILYTEQQRFKQLWLWLVVLGVAAIFWVGFAHQVLLGQSFGSRPVSSVQMAVLFVVVGLGLPYFFYRMRLVTEVLPGELRVRFWPFHVRAVRIHLHEVRDFERVTYNPIADYGGWGIRWGFKGKAYNVSGQEGVLLHFYNHKPLLIGSQQPAALFAAIAEAKRSKA